MGHDGADRWAELGSWLVDEWIRNTHRPVHPAQDRDQVQQEDGHRNGGDDPVKRWVGLEKMWPAGQKMPRAAPFCWQSSRMYTVLHLCVRVMVYHGISEGLIKLWAQLGSLMTPYYFGDLQRSNHEKGL